MKADPAWFRHKSGAMIQRVMISGCSGGGKSSLIAELSRRGYACRTEPGRRLVSGAPSDDAPYLPWIDMVAFAEAALRMAVLDHGARCASGPVFFDRGIPDAGLALAHAGGGFAGVRLARRLRYHPVVFMTPPWRAIFVEDAGRRHGFDAAVAEYTRLRRGYALLGYCVVTLPRIGISARADWLMSRLRIGQRGLGAAAVQRIGSNS